MDTIFFLLICDRDFSLQKLQFQLYGPKWQKVPNNGN